MRTSLLCAAALSAFAATNVPIAAQTVIRLSPTATCYRTNQDPFATDAFSIPIQFFGVQAGDWLKLRCVGNWDNGLSGDVLQDLVGCFASSGTLQPNTAQQRVSGVAAGTAFSFPSGTAIGNLPMEIGEDFWISRTGFVTEVTVRVPAGGTDLFVCVPDAFYGDNSDPDANLGVEITLIPPSRHPGTGEDSELGSAINGAALDTIDTKTAVAGDVIHAAVRSPLDTQANNICVIVADVQATGTTPVGPLPNTWFGLSAVIALPFTVLPSGAPSPSLNIHVPPGFAGLSLWLQGGTVWSQARNGLFTATNAHEIRLQ
jgi:hypothetical protein